MNFRSLGYAALNLPMRALLRSPLHRLTDQSLCILCYRGRRSGRTFETPLSYMREGNLVRLLSSHRTRWWTNFLAGEFPVEVEIGRKRLPGRAIALREDSEPFRNGVRRFLTAVPRDAVVYGVGLDSDRRPLEAAIEKSAAHIVLVEIELDEPGSSPRPSLWTSP